jgi:nucleotide-binding universal stress UspA family protein
MIFGDPIVRKQWWQEETTLFKSILVPTDGSDLATKAVEQAIVFAKEIGAKITAMTVTEPFPPHLGSVASSELEYAPIEYMKHAEAYAETLLGTVSAAANSAGVACEVLHVEHGHIYQAIIDSAGARKCDLIVMASHGRRGVSAVVLGSETVKVLTHSKIPVLVYRWGSSIGIHHVFQFCPPQRSWALCPWSFSTAARYFPREMFFPPIKTGNDRKRGRASERGDRDSDIVTLTPATPVGWPLRQTAIMRQIAMASRQVVFGFRRWDE